MAAITKDATWNDIAQWCRSQPGRDQESMAWLCEWIAKHHDDNVFTRPMHRYLQRLQGASAFQCASVLVQEYHVRSDGDLHRVGHYYRNKQAHILAVLRHDDAPDLHYSHRAIDLDGNDTVDMLYILVLRAQGYDQPIDRRVFSTSLLLWATRCGLLARKPDQNESGHTVPQGRLYISRSRWFDPATDLPPDAAWVLLQNMLEGQTRAGKSLARNPLWQCIDCYPQNDAHHTASDARRMEEWLVRLSLHGYIWFQSSGELWDLSVRMHSPHATDSICSASR